MKMKTTQPKKKLVRDLEVGDVIHCEDFDNPDAQSHVTITKINPYGTSYHSLIITGELWQGRELYRESYVFDKLTEIRTLNHLNQ
tara:strand:+ start:456 stop:710 length:255 start_codon:yes stop_codon:yes gene_type:complete